MEGEKTDPYCLHRPSTHFRLSTLGPFANDLEKDRSLIKIRCLSTSCIARTEVFLSRCDVAFLVLQITFLGYNEFFVVWIIINISQLVHVCKVATTFGLIAFLCTILKTVFYWCTNVTTLIIREVVNLKYKGELKNADEQFAH